jgi:hypothetical protein
MVDKIKEILDLFYATTSMMINSSKYMITYLGLLEAEKQHINHTFHFLAIAFDTDFKYLG